MKKLISFSVMSFMTLLVLIQCKQKSDEYVPVTTNTNENFHSVTVKEVLNANAYTYLFVAEGDKEYWMAIPSMEVEVGKNYTYENGMEMKNFESKDLGRTFESVYFVEALLDPNAPVQTNEMGSSNPHGNTKSESGETKTTLADGITLVKGAISLHDLFAGKEKFEGKSVTLTGKVVSFNPEIMGKNWIHIQDGSSFNGLNDVIVTTLAKVVIDDVVSVKGVVVLNKDLGSGYKYDILIEDAVIVK